MGEVNIVVNGRSFKLGCDDGEEKHLLTLAEHLGKHIENLKITMGKAGDEQLYLMAGLMVCDELWDARSLLLKAEDLLKKQAAMHASTPSPKSNSPTPPSEAPLRSDHPAQSQVNSEMVPPKPAMAKPSPLQQKVDPKKA